MRTISIVIAAILCHCWSAGAAQRRDSLLIMFWNLENFFDWKDDSLSVSPSDSEFSSFGRRHWTKKRFQAKCNAIAKSFLWIQDLKGRLPDAVGVAEVENQIGRAHV